MSRLAKKTVVWAAVVVAQCVEWSLPTPEIRGSKPVIRNILFR